MHHTVAVRVPPAPGAGDKAQVSSAPTYSRKGEEGDADECEGRRQQPPVPGLWILVPVANGGESDLQGGDQCPALGQTASKLKQHSQNSHNSRVAHGGTRPPHALSSARHGAARGAGAPAGMGSTTGCRDTPAPALLTCWFHTSWERFGAFCCHRESCHLVQRLAAARNLPQEGLCLRQGEQTGSVPPNSLSAAQESYWHAQRPAAVYSQPSQQCPSAGLHSPI